MELKVYDAMMARKQKPGRPTIRINFKVGVISIGQAAMKLMELKPGDQVKLGYSEKREEWFIWKVKKEGFLLRPARTLRSTSVLFNNITTTEEIAKTTKYNGESALVQIGSEPETIQDQKYINYWPIITATLIN